MADRREAPLTNRIARSFQHLYARLKRNPTVREMVAPPRFAVYLGDNLALTKTVHGQKIFVDTRDCSLAPHILLDGNWEPWITNVFRRLVKPGMHVVDIGANVGWYSLLAADLVGPEGRLMAFEANPALADICYRNLKVNGLADRATVANKAVYNRRDTLEFHIFRANQGGSSLFASPQAAEHFRDVLQTISVEAVPLDEHFAPGSRIDFIKMDVEGAEPFVLEGAKRVISENRDLQIMMEWAPQILCASYSSVERVYDLVIDLGLQFWQITEDSALRPSCLKELKEAVLCDVVLKR